VERGKVERNTPTFPLLPRKNKLRFYYESTKRELKIRPIYECRCDARLKITCKNNEYAFFPTNDFFRRDFFFPLFFSLHGDIHALHE
jgi:hypothetical protein